MFKLCGTLRKDNRILKETVVCEEDEKKTRTAKVLSALGRICVIFNLAEPIWMDAQIREFQRRSHTRFGRDSFVEDIDFDYLEIEVTEE